MPGIGMFQKKSAPAASAPQQPSKTTTATTTVNEAISTTIDSEQQWDAFGSNDFSKTRPSTSDSGVFGSFMMDEEPIEEKDPDPHATSTESTEDSTASQVSNSTGPRKGLGCFQLTTNTTNDTKEHQPTPVNPVVPSLPTQQKDTTTMAQQTVAVPPTATLAPDTNLVSTRTMVEVQLATSIEEEGETDSLMPPPLPRISFGNPTTQTTTLLPVTPSQDIGGINSKSMNVAQTITPTHAIATSRLTSTLDQHLEHGGQDDTFLPPSVLDGLQDLIRDSEFSKTEHLEMHHQLATPSFQRPSSSFTLETPVITKGGPSQTATSLITPDHTTNPAPALLDTTDSFDDMWMGFLNDLQTCKDTFEFSEDQLTDMECMLAKVLCSKSSDILGLQAMELELEDLDMEFEQVLAGHRSRAA